mmetsp:Transcript_28396/g.65852  ORF Transcript_28396/g.65852 Transcript_28396/m.65852 type:complete len:215 (+) Transcript_28396:723-1367(+)
MSCVTAHKAMQSGGKKVATAAIKMYPGRQEVGSTLLTLTAARSSPLMMPVHVGKTLPKAWTAHHKPTTCTTKTIDIRHMSAVTSADAANWHTTVCAVSMSPGGKLRLSAANEERQISKQCVLFNVTEQSVVVRRPSKLSSANPTRDSGTDTLACSMIAAARLARVSDSAPMPFLTTSANGILGSATSANETEGVPWRAGVLHFAPVIADSMMTT